jgi:hypothetical protein
VEKTGAMMSSPIPKEVFRVADYLLIIQPFEVK